MRQSPYEASTLKRILKYLLWVVGILWLIVSFILGYFYLLATGDQISKKG
jgi:preprotein translocase subunit SecG